MSCQLAIRFANTFKINLSEPLARNNLVLMKTHDIALIGATGLVGNLLLEKLSENPQVRTIKAVTRKPLAHVPAKTENLIINFDRMTEFSSELKADIYICCLGTTIKVAGSQEAFKRVDYDYVIQFAKIAEQNHATKFQVISAMGADAKSSVFYNRTKGEMEEKLKTLKIPQIEIFQPSLILGERKEKRTAEDIAQALTPVMNFFMKGPLEKYRPIKATDIATAMMTTSTHTTAGAKTYKSNEIQSIASQS